jgi:hypothetical protein
MVIRLRDENTGEEYLFIWESTTRDYTYDFLTGKDKNGPRLVSAHEKLYQYSRDNFTISYRPMIVQDKRVIEDMEDGITDLYMWALIFLMSKVPYETDLFELSNAHLRLITGVTEKREISNRFAMFCSELIAYTYRNGMGFSFSDYRIGRSWAPEDYSPEDFAEETQGIPFAMDFYREEGAQLIRPAQAIFGGQYIVATNSKQDKMLDTMYSKFIRGSGESKTSLKDKIGHIFDKTMPEIVSALLEYQKELQSLRRDKGGGMQEVPLTRLKFVYRTQTEMEQ